MTIADNIKLGTKYYLVQEHGCAPGTILVFFDHAEFSGEWGVHYYAGFVRKVNVPIEPGRVYVTIDPAALLCDQQPAHRSITNKTTADETTISFSDVPSFLASMRTFKQYSLEILTKFPEDVAEAHLTLVGLLNA